MPLPTVTPVISYHTLFTLGEEAGRIVVDKLPAEERDKIIQMIRDQKAKQANLGIEAAWHDGFLVAVRQFEKQHGDIPEQSGAATYYVVVRGSLVKRQYYHWSDDANDVVWQNTPFHATRWHRKDDAEQVAALYEDARVLRRTK